MKIRELLSDESKWTKGCNARDWKGVAVDPTSPDAACWCIVGAMYRCYGLPRRNSRRDKVETAFYENIGGSMMDYEWNDAPERTFAEVKQLVDELDI